MKLADSRKKQRLACATVGYLFLLIGTVWFMKAWFCLIPAVYLLFIPQRSRIPVLTYHSIHPDPNWMHAPDLVVSPSLFAKQMQWLRQHNWQCLWMDELYDARKNGTRGKFIAIHFDDGYKDTLEHALPILQQYECKGTVFIAPALLQDAPLHSSLPARTDIDHDRFLSQEDITMISLGSYIEVQSHAWTHRELTVLPENEIKTELCDSRSFLEALTQKQIRHICFPRDAATNDIEDIAIECGYISYTAGNGYNGYTATPEEVSRLYCTAGKWDWFSLWCFRIELRVFFGELWLVPFLLFAKRCIARSWKTPAHARMTP